MTRTFLYIFTLVLCVDLIGQGVPRFLWTPVVRPFNYQPKSGVNRYDPTKTGQSFTHSVRWGNYPNQFKPTQKSVRVGNTATTVRGRGYAPGSARRNSKGIAGVSPTLQLHGPPQRQMLDHKAKFSDFILDYRTDIFTSSTAHGFFTGDMVKFDNLPQLNAAEAAGNSRNPGLGPTTNIDPGVNPANNPLPGLLNEDGYYEGWMGDTGTGTGPAGGPTSNSELNATLFSVRRIDDFRLTLHPTADEAHDGPRYISRTVDQTSAPNTQTTQFQTGTGANTRIVDYYYPGRKPSNFVVNTPVMGDPATTPAGVQAIEITKSPYTLSNYKDICVSSDFVTSANITVQAAPDSLLFTSDHNLVDGQGIFFDNNPPAPLNTEDTYYVNVLSDTRIRLFNTSANARAGGAAGRQDLTNGTMLGGGAPLSFTLYKTFAVRNDGPQQAPSYINRANHGLKTGDIVYWNRTRFNDTNPNAGPGATNPTPNTPGAFGGNGLYSSNEHFYVSVNGTQVWLHLNDQNATVNGDLGPGANPLSLDFRGANNNDCVGNNRFPIYTVRNNDTDWKWRTSSLSTTTTAATVDVDKWRTVSHPGPQPDGVGQFFEMVWSPGGTWIDPNNGGIPNTIVFAAGACPWRTGDLVTFEDPPANAGYHTTAPIQIAAGITCYVHNLFEEVGVFNVIKLYAETATLADVYNDTGVGMLTITANNNAHLMNSPIKCRSTSGVHLLETGDMVRVPIGAVRTPPAAPAPAVFGNGPDAMTAIIHERFVSVRSRNANNEPWVYFHDTWADAMNTEKPQRPGFPSNPQGTREAPGANPLRIWNAAARAGTLASNGKVVPYKLRLQNNDERLRSGDGIIFPPSQHGTAAPPFAGPAVANNLPRLASIANPITTDPAVQFNTEVFAGVSKGNNNSDPDPAAWTANNLDELLLEFPILNIYPCFLTILWIIFSITILILKFFS